MIDVLIEQARRFADALEKAVAYAEALGAAKVHCIAGIAPPGAGISTFSLMTSMEGLLPEMAFGAR